MNAESSKNRRSSVKGKLSRTAKRIVLVGAVLGALLVWIYAIGYDSTLFERTFTGVPVTLTGEAELASSAGYTLAEGQQFSSITIVAKGKRAELNALSSENFRAVVDISGATSPGEQTFNIVVYSPNGIEVVSQSSSTVMLFVDDFTQRTDMLSVDVDTGTSYIMSQGVNFVSATANPVSVIVSGPRTVLDSVAGAYVKFNLDGVEITDSVYGYGEIELRDKNGNVIDNPYISVSERNAYVTISVTKQKTIPVRVALTGGVFSVYDISAVPSVESITVSGTPGAIDAVKELVLKIDETTVDGKKTFDFAIGGLLPAGVSNESGVSKISVEVTIPGMALRTYTPDATSVRVLNLPEGAEYTVRSLPEITVMGALDAFNGFDPDSITLTVDFSRIKVNTDGSCSAVPEIGLGEETGGLYVLKPVGEAEFIFELPQESAGNPEEGA
ncbi:MAG: hypothetical protein IK047_00380 [Clostridia bacterium]|nr:hypothetical protein [Clostridia bacterium]